MLLTNRKHTADLGQNVGGSNSIQCNHFDCRRAIVSGQLNVAAIVFNDQTSQLFKNGIISCDKQTICGRNRKQFGTPVPWQLIDKGTQGTHDFLRRAVLQGKRASARTSIRRNIQQPNRFFKLGDLRLVAFDNQAVGSCIGTEADPGDLFILDFDLLAFGIDHVLFDPHRQQRSQWPHDRICADMLQLDDANNSIGVLGIKGSHHPGQTTHLGGGLHNDQGILLWQG